MVFTHTIACEDRDFPEWHGGRSHALVWALLLEDPELEQCITAARQRLGALLLPRYHRQPHVTVAFAGLAAEPGMAGYDEEDLAADLRRLGDVAGAPVNLRATGWDTFPMVPYLSVESDWTHRAQAVLERRAAEHHHMPYVPHVTLGHWAGAWPREAVVGQLRAAVPTRTWEVSELSLMRYETHDIAGRLERVGSLDLTSGTWDAA